MCALQFLRPWTQRPATRSKTVTGQYNADFRRVLVHFEDLGAWWTQYRGLATGDLWLMACRVKRDAYIDCGVTRILLLPWRFRARRVGWTGGGTGCQWSLLSYRDNAVFTLPVDPESTRAAAVDPKARGLSG
jgi:hypothetical protein